MQRKKLKWCRAVPIIKPDNIISSKARLKNDHGFIPTYENEKAYSMTFIMSNEYMRKWFNERDLYFKKNVKNQSLNVVDQSCKRRYVNRQMNYKTVQDKPLPIIQLKQFKHLFAPKTVETPVQLRYKPDCSLHASENEEKDNVSNK